MLEGKFDAACEMIRNSDGVAGWHLNGELCAWEGSPISDLIDVAPSLSAVIRAQAAYIAALEAVEGIDKRGVSDFVEAEHAVFVAKAALDAALLQFAESGGGR